MLGGKNSMSLELPKIDISVIQGAQTETSKNVIETIEEDENDTSLISDIIKVFDGEHGIILSGLIGLVGNIDYKISPIREHDGQVYDANLNIGAKYRLGDRFKVLHSDGFILFENEVEWAGIIKNDTGGDYGYIFGISGRHISNSIDSFFGDEETDDALALFIPEIYNENNCKCFTNDSELSEISQEFTFMNELSYNKINDIITIGEEEYRMILIDSENRIYRIMKK